MARKRKQLDSRKYSSALSGVAWPTPGFAVVAGGGGKASSGVPNRVLVISCAEDKAGEEVNSVQIPDAPYRLALSPDGKVLLVALLPTGLMWINIENSGSEPRLVPRTGDIAARLKGIGSVSRLTFSADGRLVALAKEDGTICVHEFPSFMLRATLGGPEEKLTCRHLSFSAAHGNRLVSVVSDEGTVHLWAWEKWVQLLTLTVQDAGLKSGRFERCFFGGVADRRLYTTANCAGTGYLVAWQQNLSGEIEFVAKVKVGQDAITSMEPSPDSQLLALGSVEGDVFIYNTQLQKLKLVKGQHAWYITEFAWAQDSHAVLSVSGGASALVTTAPRPGSGVSGVGSLLLAILVLLLAVLAAMVMQRSRAQVPL